MTHELDAIDRDIIANGDLLGPDLGRRVIRVLDAREAEIKRLREALDGLLTVAEMTTFSDQFPRECEAARAALSQEPSP